jgi:hypothetical protein
MFIFCLKSNCTLSLVSSNTYGIFVSSLAPFSLITSHSFIVFSFSTVCLSLKISSMLFCIILFRAVCFPVSFKYCISAI